MHQVAAGRMMVAAPPTEVLFHVDDFDADELWQLHQRFGRIY
jgi:hypothetical protein